MAYRGLTTSGANYLATRLAQELPVEFTKVQIGTGTPAGNPADVTELQNYKLDAKILKKSQENNTVEITIQVVNDNVEQGFYLKEIGVFVNDDTEKLYWYCNEDNAQYIPAKTDSAIAFEIDIKMEVTNVESPILNWSGQGTWVNKDYLEEVLRNYTPNTRQMTAGKGLTGGGNFTSDKTFNVVSANDGIIVNEDNIQLNPVDDLSNSSTTRALAANQGLILDNKDKGIVGGYNGKFPLTSATKGNIYLLENTQKYYICITDYNGSKLTTPNANFEELSVYTNRSKLDNLGSPLPKWEIWSLSKKSVIVSRGLYMVYRLHDGYRSQSKVYFMSITKWNANNEFIRAQSFISDLNNDAYALEYNSATGEVKLIDAQADSTARYIAMKLI